MPCESISLSDPAGTTVASVLPALGFNCYRFAVASADGPVEVLWAHPEFAAGGQRPTRSGIPILFPFAGRLRGTGFRYGGREFRLAPGDDFGNAIHGFVLHRPWRVVDRSPSHVSGEFQAARDDPALLASWPADFRIRLTYRVSAARLRAEVTIENPDRVPLPCGLGFHGYYRVPLGARGDAAQCLLRVPVGDCWELEQLLPSGRRVAAPLATSLAAGRPLGATQFDDVFDGLATEHGACTSWIDDRQNRRRMTMRFGAEFPRCVVFNPPHREAVCVEPYTTAPDAFELLGRGIDPGLLTLAPGAAWSSWFEIALGDLPDRGSAQAT